MREAEVHIDAMIGPVEESFALLNKHELLFNTGNAERVDSLTYTWNNLNALVRLRKGLDNRLYETGVSAEVHLWLCVCCLCAVSGSAEPEHSSEDSTQHEGRPAVCCGELPGRTSELLH